MPLILQTDPLYFIALLLPDQVSASVDQIKHDIAANFQSKAALRSPPHITLHMPFRLPDKKKEKLNMVLESFAQNHMPFELTIKGFGAFPPRVIYIGVAPNEQLDSLQAALLREMRREMNTFNGNYKERGFHPHITIAFRDLKPRNFKAAWEIYQKETLFSQFIVPRITLLKHDGKLWKVDKQYKLRQAT